MQTALIITALAAALAGFFLFQQGKLKFPAKMNNYAGNTDDAAKDLRLELEMIAGLAIEKMEEKIAVMDVLIKEAEEKSNQLDAKLKLVNSITRQNETDVLAANKEQPLLFEIAQSELKKESKPLPQDTETKSDNLAGDSFSAEEPLSEIREVFSAEERVVPKEIFYSDKHRMALMMIQEGYEIDDIAKVTGLVRGEVMLMQGLHTKNKDGNWQMES